MQYPRFARAVLLAADGLAEVASHGVAVNCSVAGAIVLLMAHGEKMTVNLAVGHAWFPYGVTGYTATGSSGTFTAYALYK